MKKKLLLLLVLLVSVSASLWSQVSVVARVDKTNLTMDDELVLTVEITGAKKVNTPQLPSLPAFNVYARSSGETNINGNYTFVFHYSMLPRVVGNATIGAITVTAQGKTYKTQPIEVHVYRSGTATPQADTSASATANPVQTNYDSSFPSQSERADPALPPLERDLANQAYKKGSREAFFMVAAVSNYHPYVNQPISLAVRFYYMSNFSSGSYVKPSVSNFFIEEKDQVEGTQKIGGKLFRYREMRYALVPAAPGEALISSASVNFTTVSDAPSAFAVFDQFFGGLGGFEEQQQHSIQSAPIKLDVRALPTANKPDSFYGAVGSKFTLTAKADPVRVEAGEAVTWTVTAQGVGNLKTAGDLPLPAPAGFKDYPASSTSGQVPGTTSRSFRTFKTVLVPSASGTYTLPSVPWSYFDPVDNTYKTLYSPSLTLTVTPATKSNRQVDFGALGTTPSGVRAINQDINYVKPLPAPKPSLLAKFGALGFINWVVLVLLGVCVFVGSVGKKSWAKKQAFSQARNALQKAKSYEDISDTVSAYFAQKLKITTGSLPLKEIVRRLEESGCTPTETEKFARLWQTWEAARFAPTTGNNASGVTQQAQEALNFIKMLEEKHK